MQVLVPAFHVPPAPAQSVARLASAVFTPSTTAVKFAFTSSASAVVPAYGPFNRREWCEIEDKSIYGLFL